MPKNIKQYIIVIFLLVSTLGALASSIWGSNTFESNIGLLATTGKLRVKVSIRKLYSDVYSCPTTDIRHAWYYKFSLGNSSFIEKTQRQTNNTRNYIYNYTEVLYNEEFSAETILPTLKYDFIGFEDQKPHSGPPDGDDKSGGCIGNGSWRPAATQHLNKSLNLNNFKLGTTYLNTPTGRSMMYLKVEVTIDDLDFGITEVEGVNPGSEVVSYEENENLCKGRKVRLRLEVPDNPEFIELPANGISVRIDAYKKGNDRQLYNYSVAWKTSQRATGKNTNAQRPPQEECTGDPIACGPGKMYDPTCQTCTRTPAGTEKIWDPIKTDLMSEIKKEKRNGFYYVELDPTYSAGSEVIYRARFMKNSGLTTGKEASSIFIRSAEPVLFVGVGANINENAPTFIETAEDAQETYPPPTPTAGRNSSINISKNTNSGITIEKSNINSAKGPTPIGDLPIDGDDPIGGGGGTTPDPYFVIDHVYEKSPDPENPTETGRVTINKVLSGTGKYEFYLRNKVTDVTYNTPPSARCVA